MAETYGYRPSEVDALSIREAIVMIAAARRRSERRWAEVAYVTAHIVNSGFRAPRGQVTPKRLFDQLTGGAGIDREAFEEMQWRHEKRVEETLKRKRREKLKQNLSNGAKSS